MAYDFSSLSWLDFEELTRDLLGEDLGIRFEAFAPGPDGGMDGRHAAGEELCILQAKHYLRSSFSTLKKAMKAEVPKIVALGPSRYLLATSRPLSPTNKRAIAGLFGNRAKETDIYGPQDLNQLLVSHQEVEKRHIKLWLSSSAVLDRLLRSAAHAFSAMSREEIEGKVKVYAPNRSFTEARARLEDNHVVIISGPPGVGKTTLAEMLSFAYLTEGWEFIGIRSLDDGLASIVDARKQIFFFDDFLGKIALDARALASKDSDLVHFIGRVRRSPNARFILTTRAYILEEARRVSEHMADRRVEVAKYVMDVGVYTRRIRARILYNHLLVAGTPATHIRALVESGQIAKIVDHKNYNPRIVEWMTDPFRLEDVSAKDYIDVFLNSLANPGELWDIAFRTHIPERCRHLLYCLYFGSQYGMDIDDLEQTYASVHPALARRFGLSFGLDDFGDAIKILEGGFIQIRDWTVSFVNPSLRDYMSTATRAPELLNILARAAIKADWAQAVWRQANTLDTKLQAELVSSFLSVAEKFPSLPTWRTSRSNPTSSTRTDLDAVDRVELLLDWRNAAKAEAFSDLALQVATHPPGGVAPWEARWMINLISRLKDNDYYDDLAIAADIAAALENHIVSVLLQEMSAEDLESLAEEIASNQTALSAEVADALSEAIAREMNRFDDVLSGVDSDSEVDELVRVMVKLAPRAHLPQVDLDRALRRAEMRKSEIGEYVVHADPPSLSAELPRSPEKFDDADLKALFDPLISEGN